MSTRRRKGTRWLKKTLFVFALAFAMNAVLAFYSSDPGAHAPQAQYIVGAGLSAAVGAFAAGWAAGAVDPAGDVPGKQPVVPWWAALLVAVLITAWAQQPGSSEPPDDIIAGFAT